MGQKWITDYTVKSSTFDVKVWFGDSGEHEFDGNKDSLSKASGWFRAAFSAEAQDQYSNVFMPQGDDSVALEAVLKACHQPDNSYIDILETLKRLELPTNERIKDIMFHISVYELAKKYDMPRIGASASREATISFIQFLNGTKQQNLAASQDGFLSIIRRVYAITRDNSRESLRDNVIEYILDNPASRIIAPPGLLAPLVLGLSEEIAEFGRDIFLSVMKRPVGGDVSVNYTVPVQCSRSECQALYDQLDGQVVHFCPVCGSKIGQ
ncbi:hypothetical protein K504DRAFT_486322 [Pleomassaria siparia CBS 279.74]|uniref:BTB domain-containing protein n=1 Tax=Pleomassaria siparia CBS 279.74 TaxID=1314801 RepID=A0A6G1KNI5_9PLEO|nr:hypothetical protein K504DRAFT_486322 [Pleomassaria siparia CBS 279.74]